MGLVAARCTQCGAEIQVDDTRESGYCKYCGTQFITEKVINNYNTYITNNEIHNYAGATIITSPDNPDYLCPQCQSVETRAIKLNTEPPPLLSHKSGIKWSTILFIICALGLLGAIVSREIISVFMNLLFTAGAYYLVTYYNKKQKEADEQNEENMYVWSHTYHCLRCGNNFLVDDPDRRKYHIPKNITEKDYFLIDIKKWSDSKWFMWAMLVIIPPIGLFLLYRHKENCRHWKIIGAAFLVWTVLMYTPKAAQKQTNDASSTTVSTSSSSSTSSPSYSNTSSSTKENQQKKSATAINIDWDKAIAATKNDVLQQEKMVQDIYINVDQSSKSIKISLACNNAINQEAAAEAADTVVRRLNSNAQMQDSSIKGPSKDYWGGIWDTYELKIGVAKVMDAENRGNWLIDDVVQPGVQGKHKFKGLKRI